MKPSTLLDAKHAARTKRLAPIKTTELKNRDILISPKGGQKEFKTGFSFQNEPSAGITAQQSKSSLPKLI